jgi:hypothetical protein
MIRPTYALRVSINQDGSGWHVTIAVCLFLGVGATSISVTLPAIGHDSPENMAHLKTWLI